MDYLLYRDCALPDFVIDDFFLANRIAASDVLRRATAGGMKLLTNGLIFDHGDWSSFFAGSALLPTRFMSDLYGNTESAALALSRALDHEHVAGTFTFIELQNDGSFAVRLDRQNAYPCFFSATGPIFAVSNNIHILAAFLINNGVSLSRRILPYLADLTLGCGLLGDTLFDRIRSLGPDQALRGRTGLEVIDLRPPLRRLARADYPGLLEEIARDLVLRLETLSNVGGPCQKLIDVTGGMDSRVLLAALSRLDALDTWLFNRLFPYPNPDANCAERLAELLGLRRGIVVGLASTLEPRESLRMAVFYSQGTGLVQNHFPGDVSADIIRVHGGFGELAGKNFLTKRYFGALDGSATTQELANTYKKNLERVRITETLSEHVLTWVWDTVQTDLGRTVDEGYSPEEAPIVLYRRSKARSHYGKTSSLRSKRTLYPDVLNDERLTEAALILGSRVSQYGKVNFDLIRSLGGDALAGIPLANDRWDRSIFESEEEFDRYSRPPITSASERLYEAEAEVVRILSTKRLHSYGRKGAATSKSPYAEMMSLTEENRGRFSELDELCRAGFVDRLLEKSEQELAHYERAFLEFYAASAVWLGESELPCFAELG